MPIKIIVNGYYRSGTSFIGSQIKKITCYKLFYEPLHPSLPITLAEERAKGETITQKLHHDRLWSDYLSLSDEIRLKIVRNHPNLGCSKIFTDRELEEYFDIFHRLDEDLVLQPNRAHYYLAVIYERYMPRIIHIVRNPLDVYQSIANIYKRLDSIQVNKNLLAKISRTVRKHKFFFVYDEYLNNNKMLCINSQKRINRLFQKFKYFDNLVINWVVYNYYAIKQCNTHNLFVVNYNLLDRPEHMEAMFNYLGIQRKHEIPFHDNKYEHDQGLRTKFYGIISKYGLVDMLDYVVRETSLTI